MKDNIKKVKDGKYSYKFYSAGGKKEERRIKSALYKEAGTIEWINSLNENDIFFDIGANIGIYTIYAAPRVKKVVAFEPHLGNAFRLLQNIDLNNFKNVNLIASPIHNKLGLFDFSYRSLELGESFNELSEESRGSVEQKVALHLDFFVENHFLPMPTCVKLDVDGNEFLVLQSMKKILSGGSVKSLIVEYNREKNETVENNRLRNFLEEMNYRFIESQFTELGQRQINNGVSPDDIDHNFLFKLK
jgi:FkbM family methyltransferase